MEPLRLRIGVAAAVFLVAFGVYLATLTPTVGFTDSGELTTAAWSLGNAHPPGFPVYLVATHLFTKLPIGTVAVRANVASAFFAALACAVVALIAFELMANVWIAAVAGLLLTFSRILWSYATVAEVYALNTLLLAAIWLLLLAWRRTRSTRLLYAAAALFGLALGVHHVTIGLCIAGIASLVFRGVKPKTVIVAAIIAMATVLIVYAYLPIAAAREPVMNWGDPDDLGAIVDHVSGKQYRQYISAEKQGTQFSRAFTIITRDLGPRWFPLALLLVLFGFVQLFRRDRMLLLFLALIVAANFAWVLIYPIANDLDAYMLPTILALIVAATAGAAAIPRRAAPALFALPLLAALVAWPYRERSDFLVPKLYVENALKPVAPNALLITNDWQLYAPFFYFHEVEGMRRDMQVLQVGMLIRSWYLDFLARRYPQLIAPVRPQFDDARRWVEKWETTDADAWAADATSRAAFYRSMGDLIVGLVTTHRGPVYATGETVSPGEAELLQIIQRIAATHDLVPRGLVVELMPGHPARAIPPPIPFDMRGLDGTKHYEDDDVVSAEVWPAYVSASVRRARYLVATNEPEAALEEYRRALDLSPGALWIEREMAVAASRQ